MQQKGQIVLILILIMTVALAIGLSIVQKSLVDVSTASKGEQSTRAFSAAEAGIEKALKESGITRHIEAPFPFAGNNSEIKDIIDTGFIPAVPASGSNTRQLPLEIPPLAKEEVTQVWLADFNSYSNPPNHFYDPQPPNSRALDIYWGNSATDKAALELTLIYHDGTKYTSKKWYLDHSTRNPENGFKVANCSGFPLGQNSYQCKVIIGSASDDPYYSTPGYGPLPSGLILIRARLLYNTTSQPFAVQAVGLCGTDCSIPPQGRIIVSTGASGETERRVKVFQQDKVLPPYFDYAIFSAGEITKN